MSTVVGSLVVSLTAHTTEFTRNLAKSLTDASAWGDKLDRVFSSAGTKLKGAYEGLKQSIAGPGGVGVAFAAKKLNDTFERGEEILNSSRKIGFGTEAYQQLEKAAKKSGVSIESVGHAVNVMMTEFTKNGNATLFKQLGIDPEALSRMAPEKAFDAVSKAILAIPNAADRARVAVEMFGRSGADMLTTMQQWQDRGAVGLSDATVRQLAMAKEQLDMLKGAFKNPATMLAGEGARALLTAGSLFGLNEDPDLAIQKARAARNRMLAESQAAASAMAEQERMSRVRSAFQSLSDAVDELYEPTDRWDKMLRALAAVNPPKEWMDSARAGAQVGRQLEAMDAYADELSAIIDLERDVVLQFDPLAAYAERMNFLSGLDLPDNVRAAAETDARQTAVAAMMRDSPALTLPSGAERFTQEAYRTIAEIENQSQRNELQRQMVEKLDAIERNTKPKDQAVAVP